MSEQSTQALSFGSAAERYDRFRPRYPRQALEWVLGPAPRQVIDLGAGTGILTRVLLGLGHQVTSVEPDEKMRARLAETTPGGHPLAGTAEAIPVPDGSVDAVLAGQAYHWFTPERALPEIARVIRPGGVFAPIWNIRDEEVPWVARLSEIVDGERGAQHAGLDLNLDLSDRFGPVALRRFGHEVTMTADALVELVATRSYYLTATPARQAELKAQVRELAESLPETFPLPYLTYAYRAIRD
jgi:SAM-dependent methyltransferase